MNELLGSLFSFDAKSLSVAGQLLASLVLMLSGYQDLGLRARMGAAFGFFMAIAFGVSALITAIRASLSTVVTICVVVLCFEIWVMLRWRPKAIRDR